MLTYERLYALSSPHLKAYRNDLEVHDKAAIEGNPGIPFIHWTRDHGTHIVFLPEANDPCYPPENQYVKYLFGIADRHHILKEKATMADCIPKNFGHGRIALVLWYDGVRLHTIGIEAAKEMAWQYVRRIEAVWLKPRWPETHTAAQVAEKELAPT